jgi:hypothetical protein
MRTSLPTTSDTLYDSRISRLCDPDQNPRWGVTESSRRQFRLHPCFEGLNWDALEQQVRSFKQYDSPSVAPPELLRNSVPLDDFNRSGEIKKLAGPTK